MVIPPRSPASVPEPIGTQSEGILHGSEWPGFVVYYINIPQKRKEVNLNWGQSVSKPKASVF